MKVMALTLKPKDFYIDSYGNVSPRDQLEYHNAEVILLEVHGDSADETGLDGTYVIKNKYGHNGKVLVNRSNRNWINYLTTKSRRFVPGRRPRQ